VQAAVRTGIEEQADAELPRIAPQWSLQPLNDIITNAGRNEAAGYKAATTKAICCVVHAHSMTALKPGTELNSR
jgi:hypothetical protein